MAVDLARYVVSLEAQTATYVRELDKANRKLDRFHKDQERAIGKIKTAFLNLGVALASALSVRAIVSFTKASIEMADQLGETAKAAGVSARTLQELRFTLDQLGGVASAQVDQGLQRFNRTLGQAINGSRQAQQQFRLLGVAFRDSLGRARGTDETLEDVLRALGEIENDAQRAAVAVSLFGREMGPKLAAALKGGSEALEEARKQVAGIISDESVRRAGALDDMFKRMAATIRGPLREAAIDAAFHFSKIFGHVEDDPADILARKIADTEALIERLTKTIALNQQQSRAGLFGGRSFGADAMDRGLANLQAQLLQAQMNLAAFRAAAASTGDAVKDQLIEPIKDGLEEISTSYGKITGLKTFDFAAAAAHAYSYQLQEISDELVKMPSDLQQLSQETLNFIAALNNSGDKIESMSDKFKNFAISLGRGLHDSLVDAFMGIEVNFKDMLKRMAAEMAASAIFSGLGGLFPAGSFFSNFFGGFRANGGPVSSGKGYVVGERGPEMFFPGQSGMIAAGAGGVTYNDNSVFNFTGSRNDEPMMRALFARERQQTKAEIQELLKRGRF